MLLSPAGGGGGGCHDLAGAGAPAGERGAGPSSQGLLARSAPQLGELQRSWAPSLALLLTLLLLGSCCPGPGCTVHLHPCDHSTTAHSNSCTTHHAPTPPAHPPGPPVQLSLALDFLTWAVLVPMLLSSSQDPARIQFWRQRMYCFESYNVSGRGTGDRGLHAPHTCTAATMLRTHAPAFCWPRCLPLASAPPLCHAARSPEPCLPMPCTAWPSLPTLGVQQHAVNAAMMLGELLLNRIPGEPLGGAARRQPTGQSKDGPNGQRGGSPMGSRPFPSRWACQAHLLAAGDATNMRMRCFCLPQIALFSSGWLSLRRFRTTLLSLQLPACPAAPPQSPSTPLAGWRCGAPSTASGRACSTPATAASSIHS